MATDTFAHLVPAAAAAAAAAATTTTTTTRRRRRKRRVNAQSRSPNAGASQRLVEPHGRARLEPLELKCLCWARERKILSRPPVLAVSPIWALAALLLLGPPPIGGRQQQPHQQAANWPARSLLESESSINLKTIVEHQEALAQGCSQLHERELLKLEQALRFNDQSRPELRLASPFRVKVPAICLFMFSQFGQPKPMINSAGGKDKASNNKLDLVNWIFDEDELRKATSKTTPAAVNSSISVTDTRHKRQAQTASAAAPAEQEDQMANGANNLLAGFLFNPEAALANANKGPAYETEEQQQNHEKLKLHEQIETMLADPRFQRTIEQNRLAIGRRLSPVVLVPGLLGSRLQARTSKTRRVNIFCQKQTDWQDMWLSVRQLLPLVVDCWLDNVRLEFDSATGFSKAPAGVETRVPDFGSIDSVRYLDLNQPQITRYYAPVIERYQALGYTVDKNLFAAPFDFRRAPQELASTFYVQLKELIERAQDKQSTSGQPVTLVCHSMGCTQLLIFLRQQSAGWRQKRIRKLIALSSPWGGATKAVKALVVGDQLNLPLVSETKMRKLARTYPSIAFLLPLEEIFARPNMNHDQAGGPVMVQTPERSYKVNDLKQLLLDLNLTHQVDWFEASAEKLIKPLEPLPDVDVDCIHSLNVPTPETLIFRNQSDFPNGPYELVKGEGDGTVNFESLMVCEDWARRFPDKISHTVIMNTDHVGVLGHKTTLTHISDDVLFR